MIKVRGESWKNGHNAKTFEQNQMFVTGTSAFKLLVTLDGTSYH